MKHKIIIMMGIQGSGKGAYCRIMSWHPDTVHVSSGNLFRKLDPESELGKMVNEIMVSGVLVGDDIMNRMIEQEISPDKNILLDGYPRNIPQAKWLVDKYEKDFDIITIFLHLDEETAIRRRDKRINDYLLRGEEPRKDDTDPLSLSKRFAEFREKTIPTIEFLRQRLGDKFFDLDGSLAIEDVYDNIMTILSKI